MGGAVKLAAPGRQRAGFRRPAQRLSSWLDDA